MRARPLFMYAEREHLMQSRFLRTRQSSYSTRSARVNAAIERAFYAGLVLFDTIAAQARGKAKLPGKWQNRFGKPEANPWSKW
jgi:hypothetical protein